MPASLRGLQQRSIGEIARSSHSRGSRVLPAAIQPADERLAQQHPIAAANRHECNPASPIRKTFHRPRSRSGPSDLSLAPKGQTAIQRRWRNGRHDSPVHLSKSTRSSDPNWPGFGKYSLIMYLVMYLASADKRSSAARFQSMLRAVNDWSEACRPS